MITLHAIVHCEQCPAQLLIEDSPVHARNAALVARGKGWRIDPERCPACVKLEENAGQLELIA